MHCNSLCTDKVKFLFLAIITFGTGVNLLNMVEKVVKPKEVEKGAILEEEHNS